MAFWGVEVRPGKPYTHVYDKTRGRLRISQATLGSLGNGKAASKSVVQCNVGKKSPILLCSLAPDKTETCHLELEFEEDDEVVFSVLGLSSVHLSGYYLSSSHSGGGGGDETDSYGEDIGDEDSESFGTFSGDEDEYESDFIDDGDIEMFPSSPKLKSNVVIEEIVEDDKPANGTSIRRRLKKKSQIIDTDDDDDTSQRQLVVKTNIAAVFESEDEDGFPISFSLQKEADENIEEHKKASNKTVDERKRKVDAISQHSEPSRDASLASDVVLETKDTTKKKKLKDKKTGELANVEQNDDTDDRDARMANTETNNHLNHDTDDRDARVVNTETHNHLIGGVNVAVNDGKLKKKKDKIRKDKKSDVVDHAMKSTEVKGDEKEVLNTSSIDQKDPSEAEKSHNDIDGSSGRKKKKNKKKKVKEDVTANTEVVEEPHKDEVPNDNGLAKKTNKKKAKKGKSPDKDTNLEESLNTLEAVDKDEPHKTRTFSNGLTIEELSMGKPDGKKASPGSRVSVNYIGKLKNGNIFDSNVGKRPFKFRLGVGHVIKGWDVGIAGMRIGDKRRLVIPPSMGYGDANVGQIPAHSWLVFDVELVGVN